VTKDLGWLHRLDMYAPFVGQFVWCSTGTTSSVHAVHPANWQIA